LFEGSLVKCYTSDKLFVPALAVTVFAVAVTTIFYAFRYPEGFAANLPYVLIIVSLVALYLPLTSVPTCLRFGIPLDARFATLVIPLAGFVITGSKGRAVDALLVFGVMYASFALFHIFITLHQIKVAAKCSPGRRDCEWISDGIAKRFGYSVEFILPEPTRRSFWASNIVLQLSMYALLAALGYLVNPQTLPLQTLTWLLAAAAFTVVRLYASKVLGRLVCVTYESSTVALLILITLIILDRPGYAEGLIIPRWQGIEALVQPALTLLAVNTLAFAIDALAVGRGRGRLRELCLCVGQTPVWRLKADNDTQQCSRE